MMRKTYFDYASTTPVDPEVVRAMEPYLFEKFGNPSSPHVFGREAQRALEDAREGAARSLGAKREEIVFTSGGSESNNTAIFGAARAFKGKGNHIILSRIEHPSVLEPVERLRQDGFEVTYVDVDGDGRVLVDQIKKAVTDKTILISVLHASNEIGTIQPAAEIGKLAREKGIVFHVDAVQTVGHIPVKVGDLNADAVAFSAHKIYGPKGVGALYIRQGVKIAGLILGGDQENGLRASTQNVAGAVGLAKALALCEESSCRECEQQTRWRTRIIETVLRRIDGVKLNGHPMERLANNCHFSFERIQGESLLLSLDMAGIAASMGSACKAGAMNPSHVLRAIGLSDELAMGALRLTTGRWTKDGDVDFLLEQLPKSVAQLRV